MDFSSEEARIEHNMTLHPPENEAVGRVMDELRELFKGAAHTVDRVVPGSREKSMALTNLEDGLMHAIAGVARNQDVIVLEASGA